MLDEDLMGIFINNNSSTIFINNNSMDWLEGKSYLETIDVSMKILGHLSNPSRPPPGSGRSSGRNSGRAGRSAGRSSGRRWWKLWWDGLVHPFELKPYRYTGVGFYVPLCFTSPNYWGFTSSPTDTAVLVMGSTWFNKSPTLGTSFTNHTLQPSWMTHAKKHDTILGGEHHPTVDSWLLGEFTTVP